MHEPPLKDLPETLPDIDPELLPEHLRDKAKYVRGKDTVRFKDNELFTENLTVAKLDPENMVGRTFLMPENKDLSRERAKIVERITDHQSNYEEDDEMIKFRVRVGDRCEEIVAHSDIVDFIEEQERHLYSICIRTMALPLGRWAFQI